MKTTVQVEGKTHEVEIPGVVSEADVAQKYVPKEAVTQIVQDRLAQFGKGHVKIDDLDEAGLQKLVESKGFKISKGGTTEQGGDVGKQLERARAEWDNTVAKPLIEQGQKDKDEVQTLRRDRLTSDIVTAAAKLGVKASFLNPPVLGAKPPIVAMLEQAFGFDDKSRNWWVKGGSAEQPFAFASAPTGDRPYKSIDEFVTDWAKLPANREFVGTSTQGGPSLGSGAGGGGGAGVTLSRADAKNPVVYRRAKEEAAKRGVPLQISAE